MRKIALCSSVPRNIVNRPVILELDSDSSLEVPEIPVNKLTEENEKPNPLCEATELNAKVPRLDRKLDLEGYKVENMDVYLNLQMGLI